MTNNLYAIIMAGGEGTRLWPLSRPETPKQFIKFQTESFFQQTVHRATQLVPKDHIYVITHKDLMTLAKDQAGLFPTQVIGEPVGRNTAACIGLAALLLQEREPQASMIALPADHHIDRSTQLLSLLKNAAELAAQEDWLVTLGIIPQYPATGFGYIEFDQSRVLQTWQPPALPDKVSAYKVISFTEKPDRARAEEFFKKGTFLWNSGMFIWRVSTILKAIEKFMPQLHAGLIALKPCLDSPHFEKKLAEIYDGLEGISIDYGIMQSAPNIAVIPADVGWSDVGDWAALSALLPADNQGNALACGPHFMRKTWHSTLFSTQPAKTIATIGIEDLIVVDTPEALLVTHQSCAQEVREIARQVEESKLNLLEASECAKHDPDGMLSRLMSFPKQCSEALESGRQLKTRSLELQDVNKIVVLGVGGSGIVGDLLQRCLSLPVHVQHHENIPRFVDSDTLLIAVSYSGNTRETLDALELGLTKGAKALCVTSGGKLQQLAQERELPLVVVPGNCPPRAAIGHLFLSTLAVLRSIGLFEGGDEEKVASILQELALQLGPEQSLAANLAKKLALRLHKKIPLVYGAADLTDVAAQRWKTQFNENSKQPAFSNALPELSHNEIEAFGQQSKFLPNSFVILLRSAEDSELNRKRFDVLKELLSQHRIEFAEAWGYGSGQLAQMLSLIYLGDFVSVYLAILNGADSSPIPAIEGFKKQMRIGDSQA